MLDSIIRSTCSHLNSEMQEVLLGTPEGYTHVSAVEVSNEIELSRTQDQEVEQIKKSHRKWTISMVASLALMFIALIPSMTLIGMEIWVPGFAIYSIALVSTSLFGISGIFKSKLEGKLEKLLKEPKKVEEFFDENAPTPPNELQTEEAAEGYRRIAELSKQETPKPVDFVIEQSNFKGTFVDLSAPHGDGI